MIHGTCNWVSLEPLECPHSLDLKHLHTLYKRRPYLAATQLNTLHTPTMETSPFLPRFSFALNISISNATLHAEVLARVAGNQGFGELLHATARLLPEWLLRLHTVGRTTTSWSMWLCSPGERRCGCVPQVNIKIITTTFQQPSALQWHSSATSNSTDWHNVQF